MKDKLLRTLAIILPIVILVSIFGVIVYNLNKEHTYFVMNGGTGNGKKASNPASSVADVIKTLNSDGLSADDTAKIYIMQREDYNVMPEDNKHFKTYWAKNGEKVENHTAKIIIEPYAFENPTELAYSDTTDVNQIVNLGGPTIFKNIRIVSSENSPTKQISLNGHNISTETQVSFEPMSFEGIRANNKNYLTLINLTNNNNNTYNNPINVEFKNIINTKNIFYIGNNDTPDSKLIFKENVNIFLDCQDYEGKKIRSYPIVFSNTAQFDKSLNIYAKRAEEIQFSALEATEISATGGVQFIYNSSASIPNPLDSLDIFSNDTKVWSICLEPSAENMLEITENAGEYKVLNNAILTAINQNGDTVDSTLDGMLILDEGNWTLTKKNSIHYGDANSDGVLDEKDTAEIEKLIAENRYYPPADINRDKTVNSSDLDILYNHLTGKCIIEWEDYEIELYETVDLSGGADKEAEKLKKEILNAEDTIKSKGTTYYISDKGDEFNEGTSPDEALTIDAVNTLYLLPGDAVLFERGSVFRPKKPLMPHDDVYYGAYGEGEKPQILGSLRDYADPSIWTSEDGVIWKTVLPLGAGGGNVIFNNGEAVAIRKLTLEEIRKDGDYYFDSQNQTLYLKLNQYNPGHYFNNIEIANIKFIFRASGSGPLVLVSNIYIENLCLKYPSTHAFSLNFGENITIKNCDISWVGGDWYGNQGTRLGNAIEFWAIAKGHNVSNNYMHQIYDAAVTFQGTSYNDYTDITIENNLIEYSSMNFEFWANEESSNTATSNSPNAKFHNISLKDNIFRFGGYGYSNLHRSARTDQSYILAWYYKYDASQFKKFEIKNNIFDIANSYYFYGPNALPNIDISDNTYYQTNNSINKTVRDYHFYSQDKKSFESAIKKYDSNPKHIEWIK